MYACEFCLLVEMLQSSFHRYGYVVNNYNYATHTHTHAHTHTCTHTHMHTHTHTLTLGNCYPGTFSGVGGST